VFSAASAFPAGGGTIDLLDGSENGRYFNE
jgi:hypothetical protein